MAIILASSLFCRLRGLRAYFLQGMGRLAHRPFQASPRSEGASASSAQCLGPPLRRYMVMKIA